MRQHAASDASDAVTRHEIAGSGMPPGLTSPSRRHVVMGAGAAGLAGVLVACGGGSGGGSGGTSGGYGGYGGGQDSSDEGGGGGGTLAQTSDIPVGGGRIFSAEKVVVTQPEEGTFRGFSAVCTHQGCTVGNVDGEIIQCPCHGSRFSIVDGSVQGGPAPDPLPAEEITVEGEEIRLA